MKHQAYDVIRISIWLPHDFFPCYILWDDNNDDDDGTHETVLKMISFCAKISPDAR